MFACCAKLASDIRISLRGVISMSEMRLRKIYILIRFYHSRLAKPNPVTKRIIPFQHFPHACSIVKFIPQPFDSVHRDKECFCWADVR
jgi:hypothetical protein